MKKKFFNVLVRWLLAMVRSLLSINHKEIDCRIEYICIGNKFAQYDHDQEGIRQIQELIEYLQEISQIIQNGLEDNLNQLDLMERRLTTLHSSLTQSTEALSNAAPIIVDKINQLNEMRKYPFEGKVRVQQKTLYHFLNKPLYLVDSVSKQIESIGTDLNNSTAILKVIGFQYSKLQMLNSNLELISRGAK